MTTAEPIAMDVENVENVYANKAEKESSQSSSSTSDEAVVFSPQLLQMYYSRLFPFPMLHSWLSYGSNSTLFSHREFSMTIEPVPGEEIYIRYQSFTGEEELAEAILKRRPVKIDIGAVFSLPPKDKSTIPAEKFKPVQRELVFDVDLTDYDEVRSCGCSGAKICSICWGFMKMAVKIMDQGLREDFGFQHVAWFYSGRRGVHAWICDQSARELSDAGRSAVASYFRLDLGTQNKKELDLTHPLHPMLARALKVLEPMFIEQVLPASGHGLLATEEQWTELLKSIPDAAAPVREKLTSLWAGATSTPEEKWKQLKKHMQAFAKSLAKSGAGKAQQKMSNKERSRLENWTAEVVFRYSYPRLDIEVSRKRNHLLKSPFCVHPKTGRVCVPIDPKEVDNFDPFAVPTLSQLMKELDEFDEEAAKGRKLQNWEKTSLKEYFEKFQKKFLEPLTKEVRRQERDAAEEQAALAGEF